MAVCFSSSEKLHPAAKWTRIGLEGLRPGKWQTWTPIRSHCCGRGVPLSHCCGLVVAFACGRGACWACWGTFSLRRWANFWRSWKVWSVWGLANGSLERVKEAIAAAVGCPWAIAVALWWLLRAGVAPVGLVGVPFACGVGRTFGGFGGFGGFEAWQTAALNAYKRPL